VIHSQVESTILQSYTHHSFGGTCFSFEVDGFEIDNFFNAIYPHVHGVDVEANAI
jgi:hypothetical protein